MTDQTPTTAGDPIVASVAMPAPFYAPHAADLVAGMRKLADDIEQGRVPAPYGLYLSAGYTYEQVADQYGYHGMNQLTTDDARRAMTLAPGGWEKTQQRDSIHYTKEYARRITLELTIDRSTICERVQVGTRLVPAVEEHEEPVYEWNCGDDDTDDDTTTAVES